MFTGIIKELGRVRRMGKTYGAGRIEISCRDVYPAVSIGDSVAVNGACLTVAAKSRGELSFDVMAQTLRSTTLGRLRSGDEVNLEPSVRAGGSLDGHIVTGHIDCVGKVGGVEDSAKGFSMHIRPPSGFERLFVDKGSVAIDGVSLTIGRTDGDGFNVYLIPHTLKTTVLSSRVVGDDVNIEFDIIGKYVAKLNRPKKAAITEGFLRANGF